MQAKPFEGIGRFAVFIVPHYVVPDVAELDAYLVFAPGFDVHVEEGIASLFGDDFIGSDGKFPAFSMGDPHEIRLVFE